MRGHLLVVNNKNLFLLDLVCDVALIIDSSIDLLRTPLPVHASGDKRHLDLVAIDLSTDLAEVSLNQGREPFGIYVALDEVLIHRIIPEVVLVARQQGERFLLAFSFYSVEPALPAGCNIVPVTEVKSILQHLL